MRSALRVLVRGRFSLVSLLAFCVMATPCVAQASTDTADAASAEPRLAMGVIVKLKDRNDAGELQKASMVRWKASALPSDAPQRVRARLAAAAHRRSVSFLLNKPTAFAAQVIHSGQPMPLAEAQALAARLNADPDVEWAIPNEMLRPMSVARATPMAAVVTPADSSEYTGQSWIQARTGTTKGVGNIAPAWTRMHTASPALALTPVTVAVLDGGILPAPDLGGRIAPGYDFISEVEATRDGTGLDSDPSDPGDWLTSAEKAANPALYGALCDAHDSRWHGLAIANMLAALPNTVDMGGVGVLAPLPGQVVLPVRVSGICGASTSDIIEGMLWAAGITYQGSPPRNVNPARIINISLGGDGTCDDPRPGSYDWLYRNAIAQLKSYGVLVVASAGNGDDNGIGKASLSRPANCDGVLGVTALNIQGFKATYSNLTGGRADTIAVMGGDAQKSGSVFTLLDGGILTVTNRGTTVPLSPNSPGSYQYSAEAGTSFSAPMVAGVAALMLAINPTLTVDQLKAGLTATANLEPFPTSVTGRTLPQCDAAASSSRGQCYCTTSTCGAGILDADKAVAWAMAQAVGGLPDDTTGASAGYFTPDRLKPSTRGGGGGGGAMEGGTLAAMALVWLGMVIGRARRSGAGR